MGSGALILKPFELTVQGFGTYRYFAATRGRALSKAFGDWTSLRDEGTFKQFLKIASAKGCAIDCPRFGEEMTVCGEPAFYVSHNSQYIQFVRPGSDVIFNTHPLDVEPPEARRGTPYYVEPQHG
jgi:hypothetical protein